VAALVPKEKRDDQEEVASDPNQKPDELKFDEKGKKGKAGKVEVRQLTDEEIAKMWLRGVETSPAGFLKMKFAAQVVKEGESAGKGH
jgi:Ca-activated chloride channel family protein